MTDPHDATPDLAGDRPRQAPGRHARRRPRRLGVLVVGLVFLFTPTVAVLSGVRATEIENRALAPFPSVSVGWGFFPAVTTWATDHLPLRGLAVSANGAVSRGLFGEEPVPTGRTPGGAGPVAPVPGAAPTGERVYPQVLAGRDGWLFFGSDQKAACGPRATFEATLTGLERLADLLVASGRTYVLTIAPDKSTTSPDRLPASYVGDDCAPAGKEAFWERVQDGTLPGYVDLKAQLEQLQSQEGELYRPSDTHWGPRGALVYAEQVANALDPALWQTSTPTPTAPVQQEGDLSVLLGTPRTDEMPGWELARDGVVVRQADVTGLMATTTDAPLWTPSTLILGDSFTKASLPQLAPLFASARVVEPAQAAVDPEGVVAAILAADAVVLELVERSVAGGEVPVVDPAFLDLLEQALREQA